MLRYYTKKELCRHTKKTVGIMYAACSHESLLLPLYVNRAKHCLAVTNCSRGQNMLRIRIQKLDYVILCQISAQVSWFLLGPGKRTCADDTAHSSLYNLIALPEYYQSRARLRFNLSYTYCLLDWLVSHCHTVVRCWIYSL